MIEGSSRGRSGLVLLQALWGVTLLIAPGKVLRLLGGADEDRTPRTIMRVLGLRHVLQASAERVFGDPALRLGVWIDELHGLTALGFACTDSRWRRAALADAAITGAFVTFGLIDGGAGQESCRSKAASGRAVDGDHWLAHRGWRDGRLVYLPWPSSDAPSC
jgi:hypothetical protein